ncbi:MAG: phosphatidate cytidylyltransferase [Verrucomicrobiaceae bacterium]|nr:phosphatidate cytidylyltransferase [Verrucomicrobiaceae bacterium]
MPFPPAVTRLFLAIVIVLVIASIIGRLLALRATSEPGKATVGNLNDRVKSWWVMTAVFFAALASGRGGSVLIFAFMSFLALREYITVTPTRVADHRTLFAMFFIVLPYQYWLVYTSWYGMFAIMVPVYAFILIPVLSVIGGDPKEFLERSARNQWGLLVCVYFISHIPMLLNLRVPELAQGNAGLILFLVVVSQGSDVLQYCWGKLTGRHPIAPTVSPKKTVEGFAGGVLSASALGALMHDLTPFGPLRAGGIAFVITLMGFFGGLVMSAIKRDRGIKDWGAMIEGHGGMMDRIDSLCFSAPVYFHIIRYWFSAE